jgi:hypothetical protein
MNNIKTTIWGRDFTLDIVYDCYEGETVLEDQKNAALAFADAKEAVDFSLVKMKEYCLAANPKDIENGKIENIFKYIMPKYLYVERVEKKHIVALMCNYKFDPEHGIAVLFENEVFSKICKQDEVL